MLVIKFSNLIAATISVLWHIAILSHVLDFTSSFFLRVLVLKKISATIHCICSVAHRDLITGFVPQRTAWCQPQILLRGWLDIIAMSGLPDGTSAGASVSDSPRQTNSSGGVRYIPPAEPWQFILLSSCSATCRRASSTK
jgi:hypothetical protein